MGRSGDGDSIGGDGTGTTEKVGGVVLFAERRTYTHAVEQNKMTIFTTIRFELCLVELSRISHVFFLLLSLSLLFELIDFLWPLHDDGGASATSQFSGGVCIDFICSTIAWVDVDPGDELVIR
jgi:hypothetical protein